jgi:ABC-type multidrug transport system fused ATPase/permease subunit
LVQDAVEKLHYKVTILVIAHRLSTIENADNIVVLESGKIVEDGTKAELLVNDGYFAQIWGLQKRT